jgi:hypothetical protein
MASELHREIALKAAFQAGYDLAGTQAEVGKNAFGEIAKAGGAVVYDDLAPKLAAIEQQERANWIYIREARATNERLREALRNIAAGNYVGEEMWDCPSDVAPDTWLARKALAAKPLTLDRDDGIPTGETPPTQTWEPIDARHKTGLWIIAIHKDQPMVHATVRWIDPGDTPFCWEASTSGRFPEDTFTHAYFRGAPPSDVETITEAAILHRGQPWSVPKPGRHGDVVRRLQEANPGDGPFVEEQGFMTSHGRFVGRVLAGEIALASGQIQALNWPPNLFSEDLW